MWLLLLDRLLFHLLCSHFKHGHVGDGSFLLGRVCTILLHVLDHFGDCHLTSYDSLAAKIGMLLRVVLVLLLGGLKEAIRESTLRPVVTSVFTLFLIVAVTILESKGGLVTTGFLESEGFPSLSLESLNAGIVVRWPSILRLRVDYHGYCVIRVISVVKLDLQLLQVLHP